METLTQSELEQFSRIINSKEIVMRSEIKDKCVRYNNKIYCLNTDGTLTVYTKDIKNPDECPNCVISSLLVRE